MKSAKFLVCVGVAVFFTALTGPAFSKIFNPETFTLKNGLQVVVIPNHRVPVVTHSIYYRVGAIDEPPGKSGLAHFFEHLMFKGTKTLKPGQFSAIVARNGGRENAFTTHDYTGYYQTVAATIYDRPARQIPIYIAAAGPTATRLAGRIGDGFITTSGKAPELYQETLIPNLQVGLEKSGRHMDDLDKMIEMKVSFDTDHERALNDTRHWAALALSPEEKTGVEDPEEMEKLADALPVERAASRWIVSTDPEEHIEKIEPYLELGFNHLVFHAPGPDQVRFQRLYAKEVLPRLRKKFA